MEKKACYEQAENKANQSQYEDQRFGFRVQGLLMGDLKKQTQFSSRQIDVNSYMKGYYDIITTCWATKNKPNSKPICSCRVLWGALADCVQTGVMINTLYRNTR